MRLQALIALIGLMMMLGAGFMLDLPTGGWVALVGYLFWTIADYQQ